VTIIYYTLKHKDINSGVSHIDPATGEPTWSYTPTLEHARAWDFEAERIGSSGAAYVIALLGMSLTDDGRNAERWDTVDRVEEAYEAMLRLDRNGNDV
jgi:hypothetical protein